MKFLFVVVIICSAIGLSQQVYSKAKIEEMLLQIVNDCVEREGASESDLGKIITSHPPANREQKCVSACVGESLGLIKNGKTDVHMAEVLATKAFGEGDPKVTMAVEMATECSKISDPDRCEAAAEMYECGRIGAEQRNLKFEDFM